ncbi:phospholipase D-like domain-containing protein [Paracrocinitomix mangrovi]|uniref:phospholipase D-like domain-containing protein n=1 Tax=Paracrocinitomix mangrovi TaxID=2862509 RepID=UPI001C8D1E8E|nr:phospholipase D-like domain-containing protein [Paracrocinitomix mangrovi]UKN01914.1 phospholipase D-like domain-containing protein [Paracrocinitomix mangrovi]
MSQNQGNLLDQLRFEIKQSIADEYLVKSEKRNIKSLLISLAPDKQLSDLLRSEVFDLAQAHVNNDNYAAILKWVEDLNKLILSVQKNDADISERVYFSPGESCLNAILHQIQSSINVIEICLFTISDNRISDALVSRHKLGTKVKIITDNDKIYDQGSDIDFLFSQGIPIKVDNTDNHMHHKFALFDKSYTLTGSYNWTRSAERYNHENIVISNSNDIFKAFDKEFNKLWNELTDYGQI